MLQVELNVKLCCRWLPDKALCADKGTSHKIHPSADSKRQVTLVLGSQSNAVGVMTEVRAKRPSYLGSISCRGQRIFCDPKARDGSGARLASYSIGAFHLFVFPALRNHRGN